MLDFAAKLNFEPGGMSKADVEALRAVGFDDRGVLDVVLVTALFNFMNRLADGLGVEPEESFLKAKERGEQRVAEGRAKTPARA